MAWLPLLSECLCWTEVEQVKALALISHYMFKIHVCTVNKHLCTLLVHATLKGIVHSEATELDINNITTQYCKTAHLKLYSPLF